jgi:hypothetical protein
MRDLIFGWRHRCRSNIEAARSGDVNGDAEREGTGEQWRL